MSTLKPADYKQIDATWANISYKGMTIGGGGCGPTSCAKVIDPLTGKKTTPVDTWNYMKKHGYLHPGQGTAWDGIAACLKDYNIDKFKVTKNTDEAKKCLKKGMWLITVVGPSVWTSGGHYIVIYQLRSNNKISVSDPYSSGDRYQKNATFFEYAKAQKCSWICIDPDDYAEMRKENRSKRYTSNKFMMYVDRARANIRTGRGMKYKAVGNVKRGHKFIVTSYKNKWYKISSGKYKGYFIHENNLTGVPPYQRTFKALCKMNVRAGYTQKSTKIREIKKGTLITSSKKLGDWAYFPAVKGWIRIKSSDGKKKYLKEL